MKKNLWLLSACAALSFASCSDDDVNPTPTDPTGPTDDYAHVGQAVGNFSAEEWYPGGELGTTENISSSSYEDETPQVTAMGLVQDFKKGEQLFERRFTTDGTPFAGLGPAYVRDACINCHPSYGHGKRQDRYNADDWGNGYLLVIYKKDDPTKFVSEVTGMPQTRATYPFLPPVDENKIQLDWKKATDGALPTKFPDGTEYELWYPEVTIPADAFNTDPQPSGYEVRIESTIGIYGTGLIDAISDDELKKQYQTEAQYGADLNPAMWDKASNDWAATAYYSGWPTNAPDQTPRIKRYTYALTRASLQDGAGANAMWNITNVTRSDRRYLYTTAAWAKKMSETESVINAIEAEGKDASSPLHAYYDTTREGIRNKVYKILSASANTEENNKLIYDAFGDEQTDEQYYSFMVWHRGLAVPRARNLQSEKVQRGKEVFYEIGCTACHRPSWKTGNDNYWVDAVVKGQGELPKYANQTIWPYSDFVQHRLYMKNDIRTGWCRTTPLWGRGLSLQNTGAEDRLHDCRARNEIEAIMWHGYSEQSDAFESTKKFYNLPKEDREAVVEFIRSI